MIKSIKNFILQTRLFVIIISLIAFIQCGNSNHKEETQNRENKKAKKIKIVAQESIELQKAKDSKVKIRRRYAGFIFNGESLPQEKILVEEVYFNSKGQQTEKLRYNSYGQIDIRYVFEYDSLANLIKMETADGFGNVTESRESVYDIKGNEIYKKVTSSKSSDNLIINKSYNKYDDITEVKIYLKNGQLFSTQKMNYNDGFLKRAVSKNTNGEVITATIYEYDSKDNLVKETQESRGTSFATTYKYDDRGNILETANPETRREYSYDEKGNLIEDKMFLSDGSRQFRVSFTYNEKGLQKEERRFTTDDRPAFYAVYEYEFYKSR